MTIYSRLSQIYDLGWGDFSTNYAGLIHELLHDHHIIQARILDLACGTGILAIELARKGHIVKGIDISPEMIRLANSKSTGLPNVFFEVADITDFQSQTDLKQSHRIRGCTRTSRICPVLAMRAAGRGD